MTRPGVVASRGLCSGVAVCAFEGVFVAGTDDHLVVGWQLAAGGPTPCQRPQLLGGGVGFGRRRGATVQLHGGSRQGEAPHEAGHRLQRYAGASLCTLVQHLQRLGLVRREALELNRAFFVVLPQAAQQLGGQQVRAVIGRLVELGSVHHQATTSLTMRMRKMPSRRMKPVTNLEMRVWSAPSNRSMAIRRVFT